MCFIVEFFLLNIPVISSATEVFLAHTGAIQIRLLLLLFYFLFIIIMIIIIIIKIGKS